MPGEFLSKCSNCGGAGRIAQQSTSIMIGEDVPLVACSWCGGSGAVQGVTATRHDYDSYASEKIAAEDIVDICQQIQQPRTTTVEFVEKVTRYRDETITKKRLVGGFLGMGRRTEEYQETVKKPYEVNETKSRQEVWEPQPVVLLERKMTRWVPDSPGTGTEIFDYRIVLNPDCSFKLERRFTYLFTNPEIQVYEHVHDFQDWKSVPASSMDDLLIHFDFSVFVGDDSTLNAYLIPPDNKWIVESYAFNGTRLYEKGYGLRAALVQKLQQLNG